MTAQPCRAHLVLVPDASYLEDTRARAVRVAHRYGGTVIEPEQHQVEQAIRDALARTEPRASGPEHPRDAIEQAVAAIRRHATAADPVIGRPRLTLLLQPPPGQPAGIPNPLGASAIDRLRTCALAGPVPSVLLADAPPPGCTPQHLVDRGAELLISTGPTPPAVARWLRLDPSRPVLLTTTAGLIRISPHDGADRPRRALARLIAGRADTTVVLDLRRLTTTHVAIILEQLGSWLAALPVDMTGPEAVRSHAATRLLHGEMP